MNGNMKWIMWIFGVLITIAASVGGYAIARVDTVQQSLQTEYVQKVDFKDAITDVKDALKNLDSKMDRVLNRGVRNDSQHNTP